MAFDAISFLTEHAIEFWETGKNTSVGWVSLQCPLCSDNSNHGGIELKTGRYSCFRCGTHWLVKIIAKLTNTNFSKAKKILNKYSSDNKYIIKTEQNDHKYINKIKFPSGTQQLTERAKSYLIKRKFDPEYLAREWGLMSTGNTGEYKFCILAPIYLNHELISYQCRDITGRAKTPYRPCHIDQSVYNFEYSLYGIDKAKNRKCVVVEGITDVWRLGPGAVATFGIKFTSKQVTLLVKNFDHISILFDPEMDAQNQADKLYHLLRGYDIDTNVFTLESGDPGSLSDYEARKIMKEML
jgi:transposase-like protein